MELRHLVSASTSSTTNGFGSSVRSPTACGRGPPSGTRRRARARPRKSMPPSSSKRTTDATVDAGRPLERVQGVVEDRVERVRTRDRVREPIDGVQLVRPAGEVPVEAGVLDRRRRDLRELHEGRLVVLAELAGLLVREVDEPEVATVTADQRRGQLRRAEPHGAVLAADERIEACAVRRGMGGAVLGAPVRGRDGGDRLLPAVAGRQRSHGAASADRRASLRGNDREQLVDLDRRVDHQRGRCETPQLLATTPRDLVDRRPVAFAYRQKCPPVGWADGTAARLPCRPAGR